MSQQNMRRNGGYILIIAVLVVAGAMYLGVSSIVKGRRPQVIDSTEDTTTSTPRRWIFSKRTEPLKEVVNEPSTKPVNKKTSPNPKTEKSKPKVVEENIPKEPPAPPQPTPPTGFTIEDLSPEYGKVYVKSVRAPKGSDKGSFVISTQSSVTDPLIISGWKVVTNNRGFFYIPYGASDYNPYGYTKGDITLKAKEVANIYGTKSELGTSVRINKCMGYLNNAFTIKPEFPKKCPTAIDRSETISFSGECQSFLRSVRACEEPSSRDISRFRENDRACYEYMQNKFGYGSCYSKHRDDKDFFSNTWHIWLDINLPLDPKHDRLLLYDSNELLVDEFVY